MERSGVNRKNTSRTEANPPALLFWKGCDWYAAEYSLNERIFFGFVILDEVQTGGCEAIIRCT